MGGRMTWVTADDVTQRIDAGYYQPIYVEGLRKLRKRGRISNLGSLSPAMSNGPHGNVEYVGAKEGVLYLRAKNVHELSVDKEDPVFISRSDHERHKRAAVRPGDILITITGANIGACGVVPEDIPEANIIQSLAKLRIETEDDPHYVAAFLESPVGQLMIRRESVNTAREGLNFEYLAGIPVLISDSDIQRAIGKKLQKVERLRLIMQRLYRSVIEDVEHIVEGTLDKNGLISEGGEAEAWLAQNPSPYRKRSK
jgi:type I restriction enzyme S subunit